ncbi:MAG: FAD-dependent oxidoreductase [Myxococcota bacterium]
MTTTENYAKLPAGRPEESLPDHHPSYSRADAVVEARRCLYCYEAPCQDACPTEIDIPTFIRKIATGNLRGAAKTILASNVNALSCARVCPVEVLCAGSCVYNHLDGGQPPIAIGRLQQHALEHAYTQGTVHTLLGPKDPPTGRKIALVGAGPASLAAAAELTLRGHSCVIFEGRDFPGGLNTTGVAPYKMKASEALREVQMVLDLGVELRTNTMVGRDVTPEELLDQYDAVFLGVGLGPDGAVGADGEDLPGVHGAVALIERLKTEPGPVTEGVAHAVVIGGGNTAIDIARELKFLRVPEVTMVYRRGEPAMSAYEHEQEAAKHEGVRFLHWHQPVVFRGTDRVRSVQLARTKEGANGRLEVTEQLVEIPCDLVALAVGQGKLKELCESFPGVQFTGGRVVVDSQTGRTGNPRVFAGGDVANGGKEVVNATAEGKLAAKAIHQMLSNGHAA